MTSRNLTIAAVVAVLAAMLISMPSAGAVTVTVKFVTAPLSRRASVHVTTPLLRLPPSEALTKVAPKGSVLLSTTLAAGEGPALATVTT